MTVGGLPIKASTNGKGLPITIATNGRGIPVIVASNGRGIPTITVAKGGIPVVIVGGGGTTEEWLSTAIGLGNFTGTYGDDGVQYTLGTVFSVLKNGQLTAVRFWKSPADTATARNVAIFPAGNPVPVVTQVTSSEPVGVGQWIEVTLSSPVNVMAGSTYVVAAVMAQARYAPTAHAFLSGYSGTGMRAISNAEAIGLSLSGNGAFVVGGALTYPNGSFNETYYWIDVKWKG